MSEKILRRLKSFCDKDFKNLGIFSSFLLVAFSAVYFYSPVEKGKADDWNISVESDAYVMSFAGAGAVNINAVPTNTQRVFSATQQLLLSNNCPYGATVTLSSASETSNDLARVDGDSSAKKIVATTGLSLQNNSWGYSINDGLNYYQVPLRNATPAIIYLSNIAENKAIAVNYGVKIDNSILSGAYSADVIYTLSASHNCLFYDLVFDTDGGTPIESQSVPYGQHVNLSEYTTTKDGYFFDGWELVGTATTYVGDETDVELNLVNDRTVTLKAKWSKDVHAITEIQDITPTLCLNSTTPYVTATEFDWDGSHHGDPNYVPRTKVVDARDGKTYIISKLADGNCWMSQNLEFDLTAGVMLTSEDTDLVLKTSWTPTRSTQTAANVSWPASPNGVDYSYHPIASDSYYRNGATKSASPTENTERGDYNWESAGNYYNWVAATAGDGSSQTMNDSICPKGWRLPSNTGSRSYINLLTTYGLTASNATNAAKLRSNPLNFVLNGYYRTANTSGMVGQGSIGGLWTSTPNTNANGQSFAFYDSTNAFTIQSSTSNGIGYSIRCVSPSRYLIRFVDTDGKLLEEIEADEGEEIDLRQHVFSKDGYVFRRWHAIDTDSYYVGNESAVDINPNRNVVTVLQAEWWQTVWEYDYVNQPQTFTAPYNGNYKLEVWGAQGESQGGAGGYGAYATGEYEMVKDLNLYVYTGGTGLDSRTTHYAGWNGGGNCWGHMSGDPNGTWGLIYPTGGGGTDIRTTINSNYADRLLVAGGGGGAHETPGANVYGYGGGVGTKGPAGIIGRRSTGVTGYYLYGPSGAVGGRCGNVSGTCANNDQSTCNYYNYHAYSTAAGGGGYEGGRSVQTNNLGTDTSGWNAYNIVAEGGSSYVGGVQNGQAIAGNAAMPVHRQMPGLSAGQTTIVGNRTNGHARITYIGTAFE